MLVPAGAASSPNGAASARPSGSSTCPATFKVALVTDVAGLNAATDAAAWAGLRQAISHQPCASAARISSSRPTDYRSNLQVAVDRHSDLVIAASFLLTDAVVAAAGANPSTHFMLVNPLVSVAARPNLMIVTFRGREVGFLAGALAGLTTRTGVVAGVFGLEDQRDQSYRLGFEQGARYANPGTTVLAAFQAPQDGRPYGNPEWGGSQARAFIAQGADVIFGSGDLTADGGMTAADHAGRGCITVALSTDSAEPCLIGTVVLRLDQVIAEATAEAIAGRWQGGQRSSGVAEDAIQLVLSSPTSTSSSVARRMEAAKELLAAGTD